MKVKLNRLSHLGERLLKIWKDKLGFTVTPKPYTLLTNVFKQIYQIWYKLSLEPSQGIGSITEFLV